jgi:hypothetical protein
MYSVITLAGSVEDLAKVQFPLETKFDRRIDIVIPDDHGDFPDTSGYTRADYENLVLTEEDGALYRYMMNALDATEDYLDKKSSTLAAFGFKDVQKVIHGHNFGGRVFALVGFVHYQPAVSGVGRNIVIH